MIIKKSMNFVHNTNRSLWTDENTSAYYTYCSLYSALRAIGNIIYSIIDYSVGGPNRTPKLYPLPAHPPYFTAYGLIMFTTTFQMYPLEL